MQQEHGAGHGESRRDFLKKAGAVAWIVPSIQLVNMASAAAGVDGSVVTTGPPSSTSTTTTTTTEPPDCQELVYYRFKANWNGQSYVWDGGVGANDCITDGFARSGADFGAGLSLSGDARTATVSHSLPDCGIVMAAHKAGQACVAGSVAADGSAATFTAGDGQDISHIEFKVKCCVEE
jgi:hypothetical protein